MKRLPEVYRPATLRNVTPESEGSIGLGFDLQDGSTIRLAVSKADAIALGQLIGSHSECCSGMPSAEVSSNSPESL